MAIDRSAPYPSCPWIEGGLCFDRRALRSCLIAHHQTGFPFLTAFNGGEVNMEAVLAARAGIIRANQREGHEACRSCPHLETRHWPEPAHPIRLLGIAQFNHCNIACSYCYLQWQDPAEIADGYQPYAVLPAIRGLLRGGWLDPGLVVDWGGGEPSLYPEFDEALRLLTEFGATTYLHTNGSRFPQPIADGLPTGKICVICSIDAGTAETWRRIKGKDLLTLVWRNIGQYRRAGCRVILKYIVMEENCGEAELRSFVREARRAGVRELVLDINYRLPVPSGAVIRGLQRLQYLAVMGGLSVSFGATGAQFTPEIDVAPALEENGWNLGPIQRLLYRFRRWQGRIDACGQSRGQRIACRLRRLLRPLKQILMHRGVGDAKR